MQRRFISTHAGVTADELQLAHWHIQCGLVGVFEVQKLLQLGFPLGRLVAHVHVDQAAVAANAVRGVHHRVAQVELAQVLDQRFDIADLLLLLAAARGGASSEQFGFGDEVNAAAMRTDRLQPAETGV